MLQILWPGAAIASAWMPGSASSRSGLLNIAVIWRGIETIKFLEGIGAPFMLADRTAAAVVDHAAKRAASGRC